MEKILSLKDLQVSFRTDSGMLKAVRGISFDLQKGETLAIVGESGSGKSVTSRAIMGILSGNAKIDGGEIIFDGKDLTKLSEREFQKIRGNKIAMVFQDTTSSLNPIMRVGKQLTETMLLKQKRSLKEGRKGKNEVKKRALELLREVGLPDVERRFKQYPFELSGGQRQRIVIAIALSSDPDILICDEPTTALDVTIQMRILELIAKIKREHQLSVIFITHDLGVVANIADRVAVMYAGKIVEIGTVNDIFYSPSHPYTWALLSSMPHLNSEKLEAISGNPPDMSKPIVGDAFAPRNPYAMQIDFEQEPPFFQVSETHFAATWLLHPDAPKAEMPQALAERIKKASMKK